MMYATSQRTIRVRGVMCRIALAAGIGLAVVGAHVRAQLPSPSPESLSPYMNSIPPSKDFFCVGTGPSNRVLHPDRAPYTQLAEQDGVVLFSGAAPQQGLNFQLNAGSLIYRNQMSTLGGPEPTPQVGTAGTLQQRPWDFVLPWSEARWHAGEDISWQGYRFSAFWLDGAAHWNYRDTQPGSQNTRVCPECSPSNVYNPSACVACIPDNGLTPNLNSAFNLQLSRGIYQASKVQAALYGSLIECPYEFREPWFQALGKDPIFNVELTLPQGGLTRLAQDYYPTYHNMYMFERLELDGGRLELGFTRSAAWPRRATEYTADTQNNAGTPKKLTGAISGTTLADNVADEYGNKIHFDRVPKYGWETDFKVPPEGKWHDDDLNFDHLPEAYKPQPNAWRLPHKRVRTVQLFSAQELEKAAQDQSPEWTVAFVFEHPDSDRISATDYAMPAGTAETWEGWKEYKSIYSFLPQSDWDFGRLPELNDETTLLTVQAYKRENYNGSSFNGEQFKDDSFVWASMVVNFETPTEDHVHRRRVNAGEELPGDANNDTCPGLCGVDDDGDGLIDEDCSGIQKGKSGWGYGCFGLPKDDDDEDGTADYTIQGDPNTHGLTQDHVTTGKNLSTDPPGDANNDGYPGIMNVDDDGDGLIDEDTNGYQAYLLDVATCEQCQTALFEGPSNTNYGGCFTGGELRQTHVPNGCKNPLYWQPVLSATAPVSAPALSDTPMDVFASWDDDEDGLIDEDDGDDPFLVHIRALSAETCGEGKDPFVPKGADLPAKPGATWSEDCRPPLDASEDPWTYQVQYVHARTNPFWLLRGWDENGDATGLDEPNYYYYPPFSEPPGDANGDGDVDPGEFIDINGNGTGPDSFGTTGLPNVHPDCVPSPNFRGPQGVGDPVEPSGIHLIKRIVRMREDVKDAPNNFVEQTWLYRYNDAGFLKAIFDPTSVQALIDGDPNDSIDAPDDILHYADTHSVANKALIMYASQWYTFYNPRQDQSAGIPVCYEEPPFDAVCLNVDDDDDPDNPLRYLPTNGCDGETLWQVGYNEEMHIDADCSPFARNDCGWCFDRNCGDKECGDLHCNCGLGVGFDDSQLTQMGIPGAVPRFRKYLVKTARMRGGDGEMHLYRFDYLGAASSVYDDGSRITAYSDPHNIAIVDEMVEQSTGEFGAPAAELNDFYIYEDDFRINLDPAEFQAGYYGPDSLYDKTTHYFYMPAKVKTRRVVVMNYYGIALSDRLILTPGFDGDQVSLVDQRYELINTRGQAKHIYDESWVAQLRDTAGDGPLQSGLSGVQDKGRVFTELFGGHEGWYSVLRGIAQGSDGGNMYQQQCDTPEVVDDVPVQRVRPEKLSVVSATEHFVRGVAPVTIADMPKVEAAYYSAKTLDQLSMSTTVNDPAGTLGGQVDSDGCESGGSNLPDLSNQEPVTVNLNPPTGSGEEDGASYIHYDYDFWDFDEVATRWKWRWTEAVSINQGGTGNVGLEVWFFDRNGNIRFYGRGGGSEAISNGHPNPAAPFTVTYYGYDDFGRLEARIDACDVNKVVAAAADPDNDSLRFLHAGNLPSGLDYAGILPLLGTTESKNLITWSKYNDLGLLTRRCVGRNADGKINSTVGEWSDLIQTDYKLLANRVITYEDENQKTQEAWRDPYIYQIEYQHARDGVSGTNVSGTTTVNVLDKGGRFLEQRVIARADSDNNSLIDDLGWGVTLGDYGFDGALESWNESSIPDKLWKPCPEGTGTPPTAPTCDNGDGAELNLYVSSPLPPVVPGGGNLGPYPPAIGDQIVTLARSFKRYTQSSTLKPTHDIVYQSFEAPDSSTGDDRRELVRRYTYDLEERIARQEDPDGTITRLLFDPKRRPTKVFKGSTDTCPDWFPRVNLSSEDDDMLLVEHRLYNDGELANECSTTFGTNPCFGNSNTNFPNNAGKLVRIRRYTEDAEPCVSNTGYDPVTRSRDTQYVYDWRGRPVITKQLAIGYNSSAADSEEVIAITVTVFDNLDRPVFVGTWDLEIMAPDVTVVEGWADGDRGAARTAMLANALTLTETFYDERGRVYKVHSYDVGDPSENSFIFTETYRDDLDRVVAEVTNEGMTYNVYDSLNRVIETSYWSQAAANPHVADSSPGTELTCTQTQYDAFGNVERQISYDRKDLTTLGAIQGKADRDTFGDLNAPTTSSAEAIITYTDNWYDKAKRLTATVNYGTNGVDGTTNGTFPVYAPGDTPVWDDGLKKYTNASGTICGDGSCVSRGLVSTFVYDLAGRRIQLRNPKGVVMRTWYDLLGRTLLTAENYYELPDTSDTPIRYTAYHYTRGGLQDMIVAVVPDAPDERLKPSDFDWTEDAANDFAATTVALSVGAKFQATRFVYNGEIVNESDHDGPMVSASPTSIAEIQYPNKTTGLPDPTNALKFKYTIGGHVAQRLDQRGYKLDYDYGEYFGSGDCCPSVDQLTGVVAADGSGMITDRLAFFYDARGQLKNAQKLTGDPETLQNQVTFTYDAFGNLESETLEPRFGQPSLIRKVDYTWQWSNKHNRLEGITYPYPYPAAGSPATGRVFSFTYDGIDADINRRSGIATEVTRGVATTMYRTTRSGGGRVLAKEWRKQVKGLSVVTLDMDNGGTASAGYDPFGRIASMAYDVAGALDKYKYEYGYDDNGNRTFARIKQPGPPADDHDNDRSYLYGYDLLNRLKFAERGELSTGNDGFVSGTVVPSGQQWNLDVLGNWSGDSAGLESFVEYSAVGASAPGYDAGADTLDYREHHDTNAINAITQRVIDGGNGARGAASETQTLVHDEAGNLIAITDGASQPVVYDLYSYDAWNRVTFVSTNTGQNAVEYEYDALGRRISRHETVNATTADSLYYYDGNRIIEEHRGDIDTPASMSLHAQYVYGLDYIDEHVAYFGPPDPATEVQILYFALTDANYNVVALVDQAGNTFEQYSYEPYGDLFAAEQGHDGDSMLYAVGDPNNLENPTDPNDPNATVPLVYLFGHQGLLRDPLVGLIYNRQRDLRPDLGRYLQQDPNATGMLALEALAGNGQTFRVFSSVDFGAQYVDGANIYAYQRSNPLSGSDPTGRMLAAGRLLGPEGFGKWIPSVLEVARFGGYFVGLRFANQFGGWGPESAGDALSLAWEKTGFFDLTTMPGLARWTIQSSIPNTLELLEKHGDLSILGKKVARGIRAFNRAARSVRLVGNGPVAWIASPFIAAGAAYVGVIDSVLWSIENDF